MNHTATEFTCGRLLPARALNLPLKLINDKYVNDIVNGKFINIDDSGVTSCDEFSFKSVMKYDTPENYHCIHGFTEKGFLLTDKSGTLYAFEYDNREPTSRIESIGLYSLSDGLCWIDDSHSLHMHGTEGIKRYTISGDEYICLFDWNKKEILWKAKPEANVFGYAIGQGKFVYQAGMEDGRVYCLDVHTGELLWKKEPLDVASYTEEERNEFDFWCVGIQGNPRIYDNLVILGMPLFRIVAMDISTGETVWEYKLASNEYSEPLFNIDSRPYEMAITESGRIYRIESADVGCGYDKHCHRLFLIELEAETGKLIQRLEIKAPEGDLQTHIIDPFEKEISFGREKYCDVSESHYLTSFDGGLILAINLKTGVVDWHTTLPTGTPFGPFFILNNRFYVSTCWNHYVFEGEGGYIPD